MKNLLRHFIRSGRQRMRYFVGIVRQPIDLETARKKLMKAEPILEDQKELLARVALGLHPRDDMYVRFQAEHYLKVGLSAIRCIDAAVKGKGSIRTVLDLPCGYGRVMRFMKLRFPDARFTACELNLGAVEYCKRAFAVEGVISNLIPGLIPITNKFDLIWCGSLITHLDEQRVEELLRFFCDHLAPGGVCVFTTHGDLSARWLEEGTDSYGLSLPAREAVLKGYRTEGFGYADYDKSPAYGVTVVSREKITAMASHAGSWNEVLFIPHGWDEHQDVYAFRKREDAGD